MRIPTSNAGRIIALHCLIAWYNVLKDARQHMMYARAAINRRWSLIKYEARTTTPRFYTPLKDIIISPKVEYILLNLWKIHLTTH
ncbi:hypothetical protein ES703_113269 [subsurface metagenome]